MNIQEFPHKNELLQDKKGIRAPWQRWFTAVFRLLNVNNFSARQYQPEYINITGAEGIIADYNKINGLITYSVTIIPDGGVTTASAEITLPQQARQPVFATLYDATGVEVGQCTISDSTLALPDFTGLTENLHVTFSYITQGAANV